MIIDSHCHAWERWPYEPPVPDFHGKGRFEQLLHEMDVNGVDQAFLVCAGVEHNPHNNDYIARMTSLYPMSTAASLTPTTCPARPVVSAPPPSAGR